MSREAAAAYLEQLRKEAGPDWGTKGEGGIFEHRPRLARLTFPHGVMQNLESALRAFLPLSEDEFLSTPRGSSSPIRFHNVASAMLERLVLGTPVHDIINDWEALLCDRTAPVVSVSAVLGVQVKSPIEIGRGVRLTRPADTPASYQREGVFGIDPNGTPNRDTDVWEFLRVPQAALLIETPATRVIANSGAQQRAVSCASLDRVLASIVLSGRCTPFVTWTYDVVLHPAIPYEGLGLGASADVPAILPLSDGRVDASILPGVYAETALLTEKTWASLKLSIERLARSRAHPSAADRAIDLGIALECALLRGEQGTGAKGELRNKIGSRGAWLLGNTATEREAVFQILRKAYDKRSKAAHSGVVADASSLDDAEEVCVQLLRRIVQKGAYPSWEKLVLGFGSTAWEVSYTNGPHV